MIAAARRAGRVRRVMRRAAASFLLGGLLAWLALPIVPVQAHAQLLSSNPAPGQVLDSFPGVAELSFSETLDMRTARAQLHNASGELIAEGKLRLDPAKPRTLLVDLPKQPDGVYSLDWRVVSAVDGHDTSGTIAFSVGLSSPKASLLAPPGTPDPATDLPPAAEAILRGLAYSFIALLLGSALFAILVWRPAYAANAAAFAEARAAALGEALAEGRPPDGSQEPSAELEGWDAWVTGLLKALILFGALAAIFTMTGVLIDQSLQMTPGQTDPVWQVLLLEFSHHEGDLVWVRVLILPLIVALSTLLPRAGGKPGDRGGARPWWEIVGLGLLLEASYSLSGHNAALGSPLPVMGDWLHFASASAWLGGLVPLGALLWRKRTAAQAAQPAAVDALLDRVSHRFSRVALSAVIVLGLTGLYSGLLQVRTLPALLEARYGQAILVKSGLFLILIGLGALNQRWILPRIARAGQRMLRRLGQSVRVEIMLGALLLLAVGGLMSLSPAYDALLATRRQGLHERWQGDRVRMDFRAAPVQVGENEFGVDIVDQRPGAEMAAGSVLLRIQAADGSSGAVQVEARPTSPGRYTARGSYFSKMAAWNILVIWRKPRFNDVTHVFSIDLVQWAIDSGDEVNPVPAEPASVAAGRALYAANCAPCHGESGKGDGPAGRTLNPAPSDLTKHAVPGVHTDGQLFDWVSNGYPGSAMPAFKEPFSEKQRWDLVNFMRSLAR